MSHVLFEAWKMLEKGLVDRIEFRKFTCSNAVKMLRSVNPDFFGNTSVS